MCAGAAFRLRPLAGAELGGEGPAEAEADEGAAAAAFLAAFFAEAVTALFVCPGGMFSLSASADCRLCR